MNPLNPRHARSVFPADVVCPAYIGAPQVEIHGLLGTLALDPIDVAAPLELLRLGEGWQQIAPPATGRAGGPDHHLGVEHVVEIIEKAHAAAAGGQTQTLTSTPFANG